MFILQKQRFSVILYVLARVYCILYYTPIVLNNHIVYYTSLYTQMLQHFKCLATVRENENIIFFVVFDFIAAYI